jgi:hypothetical protein
MEKVLYYKIKIEGGDAEEKAIGQLDIAIKELTAELNKLHKASGDNTQQIGKLNVELANAKKQKSELTTEAKKATAALVAETTSMVGMELALSKDIAAYKRLSAEQRASPMGVEMQKKDKRNRC